MLGILQHTLGLDEFGEGRKYRNHFVSGNGSEDDLKCREAVRLGLMKSITENISEVMRGQGSSVYKVTRDGENYISEHSKKKPKVSKSKQRYKRFLEYGDMFDSFRDFLKWDAEPERSWNNQPPARLNRNTRR